MEMVQVYAQKIQGIDRASLEATISPVLRAHGVETVEVSYMMERGGWILRVIVESLADDAAPASGPSPVAAARPASSTEATADERADGQATHGIHLGLLTEISRDLSATLDVAEVIPHRYSLEVSSPGLDRPLRSPRDYRRIMGQLAKVHLARPAPDGQRVLRGRILEVLGDESFRIEVDGKSITARFADIERANLIFELPTHPKGGRSKPGKHQRH
jgi:ribosome maturation factor RimP